MKDNKSPWSFLWSVIKPYRWWYLLLFQAPVLTALYFFANNYSFKLIVDAFSAESVSWSELSFPIILFISAQVFLDVIWRLSDIAKWKAEAHVRKNLLAKAYDYVQYHSWRYFQNTPGGAIVSKLNGLVDGYDCIFANLHHMLGKHVAVVVISVFVLLLINWQVFLFMVIWCLLFMGIMLPMALKMNTLSKEMAESKHRVIGMISDNISNIFSLFYFAKRKAEYKRINQSMEQDFVPLQIKLYHYDFKFNLTGSVLYWFMLTTVFLFMVYLRKHNNISTGDFLFVMLTTIAISFDLWSMMTSLGNFLKEIGDIKSSFSILATPHEKTDDPDVKNFSIAKGSIEFRNLKFSYDHGVPIFSRLNLSIKAGEKIGLVGHSGAGKSTLISLLLKNFRLDEGQILIDDESLSQIDSDSLRAQIAYIPQDIMLFHRSIAENIGYAKENASLEEIKKAAALANMDSFIESLPEKYETLVGEHGVKLSGGQRQRIAIARSFLKNAPILILDEATSSLDSISEQEIQQSIHSMLEKNQSTVIAIAHRLSTIRHMDRIVVMEEGCIIEEGRFDDLIRRENSRFRKLWDSQVNGMIL